MWPYTLRIRFFSAWLLRSSRGRFWATVGGFGGLAWEERETSAHSLARRNPSPLLGSSPPLLTLLPLSYRHAEVSSIADALVVFPGLHLYSLGGDLRPGGAAASVGELLRGGLLPSLCFTVQVCYFLPASLRFEQLASGAHRLTRGEIQHW